MPSSTVAAPTEPVWTGGTGASSLFHAVRAGNMATMLLTSVLASDERHLHVTTGFEDWCEQQGVHPETLGAWETYEASCLRSLLS